MSRITNRPLKAIILSLGILLAGWGLCFAQGLPAPEQVLGFKVGSDYHLATYEQAIEYLRILERASPKIKLFEMGKTGTGKPMIYAVITSEENMGKLDHYKGIARRLAQVRGLTDEEAHSLAREGKAIVYIEGGVHSGEVAPPQSQIELAYDLLTSEDAETRQILANVIFLLVLANPDGMTIVADWYHSNVGTPYETSRPPWLDVKYAGGNLNRDAYMGNAEETRNIVRLVTQEWNPVILYSHHQTAPFPARISLPPAPEPTNPNLHPLFIRGKNLIGSAMGYAFDQKGQVGAISRIVFDFWYPGYLDSFVDFFHIISIMTETALYRLATPHFYTLDEIPEEYKDFTPGVFYPSPWKGGWWRLRDAVEYSLTGSKSVLATAATYREKFLYGRYQMGKEIMAKFQNEPPYAWIIPQQQWDPPVAARLLNWLITMGINVYKAKEPFTSDGTSYPAETWVIPMSQPFALYVKAIFEEQVYPDLTKYPGLWQGIVSPQKFPDAYLPPYDLAGWTLPYQMGFKASAASKPLEVSLVPLKEAIPPGGAVESGGGYAYLLSPKTNNSYIASNRILKKGGQVLWAHESFNIGDKKYPAGTMIVLSNSVARAFMESLAKELDIDIGAAGSQPPVKTSVLKAPRIALYKPWVANTDEGWTKYVFDKYEFPFTNLGDAQVRAGDLGKKFDVIVIPSMSTDSIINGNKPETMPPQYVGGMTHEGVKNIKEFVEGGGTLVTLNGACLFPLDTLGLPVSDALAGLQAPTRGFGEASAAQAAKFACPGSVLRMEFNPAHPVSYGMPKVAAGMFYGSTAFDVISSFEGQTPVTIAKYPAEKVLMSGFLRGENYIQNKAAAVEVPLGKGKVILLGFAVQNRAQPHGTFKLLFNSLYYGASR